ncbi:MAG: hypothetical protein E6Q88_04665 [Lysobacteraceae bacterium]|nr:MAG: hypothetical protein E6Q88_04665 [Xanthomonadaceae bacterium]
MRKRSHLLLLLLVAALGATTVVHAQVKSQRDRVELPVWNRSSGEIEAVLVLEPADIAQSKVRARFGVRHLDTTFGLAAGDSLGVFCDRKQGLTRALDNLIDNCVLAAVPAASKRNAATAMFDRNGTRVGIGAGQSRTTMPAWLAPGFGGDGRVDVNDITIFSQKTLPREGYVSIAGTVAKARLQSPTEIPGFADRWTSKQVSVGGGFGGFGVNVIGQVVDTPGQDKWEGLSLGLSWRTPWSGQLTVGADNLVTRGKNPFAPSTATNEDEGAVPYVRYEQDL